MSTKSIFTRFSVNTAVSVTWTFPSAASVSNVLWHGLARSAAGLPRLCCGQPSLSGHTYAVPPVDPSAEAATRQVLALIAEADAVLATGHLSVPEVDWITTAAREAGVRRVLLTHPCWTVFRN